jgi:hypothetical protein
VYFSVRGQQLGRPTQCFDAILPLAQLGHTQHLPQHAQARMRLQQVHRALFRLLQLPMIEQFYKSGELINLWLLRAHLPTCYDSR